MGLKLIYRLRQRRGYFAKMQDVETINGLLLSSLEMEQ
jgi:hypothetical protein